MNKVELYSRLSIPEGLIDGDIAVEENAGIQFFVGHEGLILSVEQVEVLLKRCQAHLSQLTAADIQKINAGRKRYYREEDRESSARRAAYEKAAPRPDGFVYLMRNMRNGMTKIGYSTNPKSREATLQSQEPEVEMIHAWPGTRETEREIHAQFAAQRVRGEWFNLEHEDIVTIEARMNSTL